MATALVPVRWVTTPEYQVAYDQAWQVVVSTIGEDYDIATIEKDSGYLLSAWKPVESSHGFGDALLAGVNAGVKESQERDRARRERRPYTQTTTPPKPDQEGVRVTCKVESRSPFKMQVRVERGEVKAGGWTSIGMTDETREGEIMEKIKLRLAEVR